MSDPAIKLFGKRIPLSASDEVYVNGGHCTHGVVLSSREKTVGEDQTSQTTLNKFKEPDNSSAKCGSPKNPSGDDECKTSKEEQSDHTSTSQEKPLKKPDKILPCPRCNSMDTKFCYFNNYNVNQPRHYCRSCQRYWTAGGTMRNVPVGAGRRKNKSSSASHHRHVVIPEVFEASRPDVAVNGMIHDAFGANGTVIAFSSDVPLSESMASGLNLGDKSPNSIPKGSGKPESMANQSSGICAFSSDVMTNKGGSGGVQVPVMNNFPVFPAQVPYPLDPAKSSFTLPSSSLLPPGYPLSFYAMLPCWGSVVPGGGNMPWATPDHFSTCSSPSSPTLGKHTRDGNMLSPSNSHREEGPGTKVLVPKTLRVDDPSEAAKSSIWATLGIQKEKGDSLDSRTGSLSGFQGKGGPNASGADKSLVLQANPAALSRSITFQESAA